MQRDRDSRAGPLREQAVPPARDLALLATGMGLAAGAVSVALSQSRPIWKDEAWTIAFSTQPWDELVRRTTSEMDAVHASYYLLMRWVISTFGADPGTVRLPSALFMGLACAAVVLIAAEWGSFRLAVLAGAAFLCLPITARYGTEARGYAMATALAAWSTWLFARQSRGQRPRASLVVAYTVVLALTGYAFLYAWLIAVPHLVTTLASRDARRRWKTVVVAQACSLLLLAPLVVLAVRQRDQIGFLGRGLRATYLVQVGALPWGHGSGAATLAAAAFCWALIAWASVRLWQARDPAPGTRRLLVLAWTWALLPGLALIGISIWTPAFTSRYVVFCAPAVALLLALAVDGVRSRLAAIVVGALVVILALAAYPAQF